MKKVRVYDFESREMWIADGYDELSELFMALSTDDSIFSEPMQSTGLLDVNGKEIYEGDIVHAYSEGARLIGVIEYFDNAYCIKDKNCIYNPLWINAEHYEVVGNIYENPELVEEK